MYHYEKAFNHTVFFTDDYIFFLVSPSQSLILDHAKHSVDPLPSGAVGMAATSGADGAASITSNAGMLPFQVQFIKNLIDESLDEFR